MDRGAHRAFARDRSLMPQAPIASQAKNLDALTARPSAPPVGNMLIGAPAPTGNALAAPLLAGSPGSPYAALVNGAAGAPLSPATQPPAMPPQELASTMMARPGAVAPPGGAAPGGAPPDVIGTVAKQISALNLQPAQIMRAADALDHARQVVRGLLDQPIITTASLRSAADATKTSGKFEAPVVDTMMSRLPPASNQPALRSALEQHLQKSTAEIVALHVAALAQGLDLAASSRAGAGQGAN